MYGILLWAGPCLVMSTSWLVLPTADV